MVQIKNTERLASLTKKAIAGFCANFPNAESIDEVKVFQPLTDTVRIVVKEFDDDGMLMLHTYWAIYGPDGNVEDEACY